MTSTTVPLDFIRGLPKCELHLHIEGTLETDLLFRLAKRNSVQLPFGSEAEVQSSKDNFADLQAFLDNYYAACSVLLHEEDFFDLMMAYMHRAKADGVVHAEVFFDPQTHTERGVPLSTVVAGLSRGSAVAQETLGVSSSLVCCFLRHLSEDAAMETLAGFEADGGQLLAQVVGFGLDSGEAGNPPEKFARVFAKVRSLGKRVCAHAGEEGPAEYVRGAVDVLGASRVDHGVRVLEDPALVARLAREQVPLTVCPNSNDRLQVNRRFFGGRSPLRDLLASGLLVCLNSDDPSYFGGYVADNYANACRSADLSRDEVVQLAKNSVLASWVSDERRQALLASVDQYARAHQV